MRLEIPDPDETIIVTPGDTLVVRFGKPITSDQADRIEAALKDRMPGANVAIVVADGMAVVRPGVPYEVTFEPHVTEAERKKFREMLAVELHTMNTTRPNGGAAL